MICRTAKYGAWLSLIAENQVVTLSRHLATLKGVVARSYAEQSAFEIEKAHESLEKAAELAPEDALVFARLAELELSRGDLDAALKPNFLEGICRTPRESNS